MRSGLKYPRAATQRCSPDNTTEAGLRGIVDRPKGFVQFQFIMKIKDLVNFALKNPPLLEMELGVVSQTETHQGGPLDGASIFTFTRFNPALLDLAVLCCSSIRTRNTQTCSPSL
jgi:hypothetical protein